MTISKFSKILVVFAVIGTIAMAFSECLVQPTAAVETYDWITNKAKSWKMEELSSSQISQAVRYTTSSTKYGKDTKSIPEGYYVQGGVVTENYYVFSVFKGDNAKNYIYIANRSDGKIIKTISGKWGHMNSFYYDWGSGQVRILTTGEEKRLDKSKDGCLDLNSLKMIKGSDCASKRSPDYGAKGLIGQGEAQADGYVYVLGWDGGTKHPSAQYTWKRNSNVIFVYQKGTKKLIKSFYIPKNVVNGEVEDISIDGNGDVYLLYNQTSGTSGKKGVAFYKISQSVIGTTVDKTKPDYTGDNTLDEEESSSAMSASQAAGASSTGVFGDKVESIDDILQLVVTILSGGVGIGGTAGIVWCGIIIMTAKDDAERLALGKRRLIEIIVGLALYAVAAGLILFLIPS